MTLYRVGAGCMLLALARSQVGEQFVRVLLASGSVALGRCSGRPVLLWPRGRVFGGVFNTNVPNDTIAQAHGRDWAVLV
jgi:hypothetical protein